MGRTIKAEYIASENILRLAQPLEGVRDHAKVDVEIIETPVVQDQPWLRLAGSLSDEEGQALAQAVRDAFGRDEIEV
jgi:hypothetical protein